ncbi:Rho GTPase-activating protein 39 [Smittium mucronatum]|uniref:Rho GTPase-activating protein 39 n=1 Tax=Smittium mucronatum TaxID=133383 RepID=A0A1R0H533_9FUNG|nr:Rho GTPase-activating protein 39 [Smittium mucronatum]
MEIDSRNSPRLALGGSSATDSIWYQVFEPDSENILYVNPDSGECSMVYPQTGIVEKRDPQEIWWELIDDTTGFPYYFNSKILETVWIPPDDCLIISAKPFMDSGDSGRRLSQGLVSLAQNSITDKESLDLDNTLIAHSLLLDDDEAHESNKSGSLENETNNIIINNDSGSKLCEDPFDTKKSTEQSKKRAHESLAFDTDYILESYGYGQTSSSKTNLLSKSSIEDSSNQDMLESKSGIESHSKDSLLTSRSSINTDSKESTQSSGLDTKEPQKRGSLELEKKPIGGSMILDSLDLKKVSLLSDPLLSKLMSDLNKPKSKPRATKSMVYKSHSKREFNNTKTKSVIDPRNSFDYDWESFLEKQLGKKSDTSLDFGKKDFSSEKTAIIPSKKVENVSTDINNSDQKLKRANSSFEKMLFTEFCDSDGKNLPHINFEAPEDEPNSFIDESFENDIALIYPELDLSYLNLDKIYPEIPQDDTSSVKSIPESKKSHTSIHIDKDNTQQALIATNDEDKNSLKVVGEPPIINSKKSFTASENEPFIKTNRPSSFVKSALSAPISPDFKHSRSRSSVMKKRATLLPGKH